MNQMLVDTLRTKARSYRRTVLRMCEKRGGYAGQGVALCDLAAALYQSVLRKHPDGKPLDRFVLSNGHDAIAFYPALAELGLYTQEELIEYGGDGARVEMSPVEGCPGFEITAGSLGQGLSQAVGIALGERMNGSDARIFCLVSDGELQEGNIWEAVMSAAQFKLGNLVLLIDNNHMQADGVTEDVMNVEPVPEKFRAFGWRARRVDGNNIDDLLVAFDEAREESAMPFAMICETRLCAGVPSLQKDHAFSHFIRAPQAVWARALEDLA